MPEKKLGFAIQGFLDNMPQQTLIHTATAPNVDSRVFVKERRELLDVKYS
jgi:hypothetical protein